jgi:hypothetical protein
MYVMLMTGAASVILLSIATALIMRSSAKPPAPIRTQSRRSQAEYDFKRHAMTMRRTGLLCLMAGAMNLALCLTVGLWAAIGSSK